MKLSKNFEINYPLTHKVVRDLKVVTEKIGDLTITGTAYCSPDISKLDPFNRYDIDIDHVLWNGTDIKPVLELTDLLADIEDYALRTTAPMFEGLRRSIA